MLTSTGSKLTSTCFDLIGISTEIEVQFRVALTSILN